MAKPKAVSMMDAPAKAVSKVKAMDAPVKRTRKLKTTTHEYPQPKRQRVHEAEGIPMQFKERIDENPVHVTNLTQLKSYRRKPSRY